MDIPEEEVRTVDATVAHPYTVEKYSDDDEDPYLEREDINEEEIITLNTVSNNHPHKGEEYGEDDKDIYLEMKNIDKGKTLQLDSATSVVPHDGEEYDDDDEDIDDVEEIGPPSTVKENLDMVEIELQNIQLLEEESHPKMQRILLIPSGTQVTSPFDPINVGLDEVMQNHPRIVYMPTITITTTTPSQHTTITSSTTTTPDVLTTTPISW